MRRWVWNEASGLLGKNPTRGDMVGVTFLMTLMLAVAVLCAVAALGMLWVLWTEVGWIAVAGFAAGVLTVRGVWRYVSTVAAAQTEDVPS